MTNVDWSEYAAQYDLLAEANPAYQALLEHCLATVSGWRLPAGAVIADFGAGTGNFSVALAQRLPQVRVLHIERDAAMNALATEKVRQLELSNWRVVELDLEGSLTEIKPLAGAVSVHALYTLSRSQVFIRAMSDLIPPGGYCYMADIGRPIRVLDWAGFIFGRYYRSHGLREAIRFFRRTNLARRANREIGRLQRTGVYWRHNLTEFMDVFTACQWKVLYASNGFYRDITDVIMARKLPYS